jgi:hypothetical protein
MGVNVFSIAYVIGIRAACHSFIELRVVVLLVLVGFAAHDHRCVAVDAADRALGIVAVVGVGAQNHDRLRWLVIPCTIWQGARRRADWVVAVGIATVWQGAAVAVWLLLEPALRALRRTSS